MKRPFPTPRWLGTVMLGMLLLCGVKPACASEDFGSWHALSLRLIGTERWTLSTFTQLRFRDDSAELFAYYLGPKLTYKVSPYLHVGMNYTYLPTKPPGGSDFLEQHRWETEINPRWPVNDWLTLDLRNRYELRWLENRDSTNERSRHRPQATIQLKGLGPLESVFFNNEFFYDYDANRYNENRLVPVGLNFRANSQTLFSIYYMRRSVRGDGNWIHSNVLGTQTRWLFDTRQFI